MDPWAVIQGSVLIILIVLIPGMALTLAVFPKRKLDVAEFLGYSMFFGMVPSFMIYLLNRNLGVPLTFYTTSGAMMLTALAGIIIWHLRKNR